jgi:dipeptidyl aminopeptidase/acylaminoacyl peptidase
MQTSTIALGAAAFASLTLGLSWRTAARVNPADGEILEKRAYALPAFEAAPGVQSYATRDEYEAAASDGTYALERLVYASDGLPVVAYTYAPRASRGALPTVVFNRGSYVQPEIAHQLVPMFHRLARAGFAVLAPLYRGSAGAPGLDEMGGAELHDLMHVVELARRLPFVDAGQLFLYGESRGGMMSLLALKNGFPARAAATFGAFTDLGALIDAAPARYNPLVRQIWPDFDRQRADILRARSAQAWPEAIDAPLLLMHGGADRDVDPAQTLRFGEALQGLGKTFELHVYAGDNHVLTAHRAERDETAVRWFARWWTGQRRAA